MSENFSHASRNVLNRHTAARMQGDTLFARIGRAVCEAECLPRKELYEAWETAKRVRRQMRGGPVIELAAGHGLLAAILLILDDTSPTATCIDIKRPPSQKRVLAALEHHWPRLQGRVRFVETPMAETLVKPDNLLVSVHACGELTDQVLDLAIAARKRVAVLPCCHDLRTCDTGPFAPWMDGPLAVDTMRAVRLQEAGFRVRTARIPAEITPKNRLLMGWPQIS